jgi:hypothetical protein
MAWPLDGARGGNRRPQRRTVRPGMGCPGPGRGHRPVPPGANHHRPHGPPRRRRRWRRRQLRQHAQGASRRAGQVRRQQRDPDLAAVCYSGAAPSPPRTAPAAPGCGAARHGRAALGRAGQPPHPVELDLVFRTERGTPVNPNHASRAFARLAASVGLAAHPHLLRHALASAMAANKEPASIIAAQLRHADGGALAQRVYIHQLPQTAPRLARLIEGVFGPAARDTQVVPTVPAGVGWRETGAKPDLRTRPDRRASGDVFAAQRHCGRDRIRTCVGNAGDFTGRTVVSPRVPSYPHLVPNIALTCTNDRRQLRPSLGVPACIAPSCAAQRRAERSWREIPAAI